MKQLLSIIACTALLQWSAITSAHQVRVVGEHLIQFQGVVDGNVEGLAIDLTWALIEQTRVDASFEIYP
ncbi:MAG: hypothetical protein MK214_06550 [Thalassotalea sp.]|nr:hypothetical protein [Thalassotalea sp.]